MNHTVYVEDFSNSVRCGLNPELFRNGYLLFKNENLLIKILLDSFGKWTQWNFKYLKPPKSLQISNFIENPFLC